MTEFVLFIALFITAMCVVRGWQRGLIGIVYGVASWIFIIIFVATVNPPIYNILKSTDSIHDPLYENLSPVVDDYVPTIGSVYVRPKYHGAASPNLTDIAVDNNISEKDIEEVLKGEKTIKEKLKERGIKLPDEYKGEIEKYQKQLDESDLSEYIKYVPDFITDELSKGIVDETQSIRKKIVDDATEAVVAYILKIFAILIAYFIAKIICVSVKSATNILKGLPVLGIMLRVAGGVFGLIEAALYISILLYILKTLSPLPIQSVEETVAAVESLPVLSFMYNNNILSGVLSALLL